MLQPSKLFEVNEAGFHRSFTILLGTFLIALVPRRYRLAWFYLNTGECSQYFRLLLGFARKIDARNFIAALGQSFLNSIRLLS